MSESLTCPNCSRVSYSAAPGSYNSCPYCGIIFSSKGSLGPDKRREERFHWSAYSHMFTEELKGPGSLVLLAKTENLSRNGARIRYIGAPLAVGVMINMYIRDMNLQRTVAVMWSRNVSETGVLSGLRSFESIPLPFYENQEPNAFKTGDKRLQLHR